MARPVAIDAAVYKNRAAYLNGHAMRAHPLSALAVRAKVRVASAHARRFGVPGKLGGVGDIAPIPRHVHRLMVAVQQQRSPACGLGFGLELPEPLQHRRAAGPTIQHIPSLHQPGRASAPMPRGIDHAGELEGSDGAGHVAVQISYGHQPRRSRKNVGIGYRSGRSHRR